MTAESPTLVFDLATVEDEFAVKELFLSMLIELSEFGHDILPTDRNVDLIWENFFKPAIQLKKHAIILAKEGVEYVGAFFAVPEKTMIETPKRRAVAYGNYVTPERRHEGIGTAMQDVGHHLMTHLGITSLISAVMIDNKAGLASCKKVGAEIIGYVTEVRL